MPSSSDSVHSTFFRDYRFWLPPALVVLLLSLVYLNPFIGDWDGLDYTIFSLHGRPSSMALGRSLFTLFNFGLFKLAHVLFGLRPEQGYLLFKFVVVAEAPLAIIAIWILARDLSGSQPAATIAALLVTFSPTLVIYSGQVMTDVPSVLFTAAALAVHVRGVRQGRTSLIVAGAALLGLGVNLRETVGFYSLWLVIAPFAGDWKFDRRTISVIVGSLAIFALIALGPFLIWFASSAPYRAEWHTWLSSMQREAAQHPFALASFWPFFVYSFMTAPLIFVALPFAIWQEWRERGRTLMFTAAIGGLFATAMLFFNYSTTINWRYFLTGLPAFAPIVGDYYWRVQERRFGSARLSFVSALVGTALIAILLGILIRPKSNEYFNRLALAKTYDQTLRQLPRDAVMISGAQTVAVQYWRGIGLGEWSWIGVGAGWPTGQLQSKIEEQLKAGHRVFLDADPRWWLPCSWHVNEERELAQIESHFHFKQITPTVYEIRPLDDESATDHPHLENLLPEKRPEEVGKCFE
jgi:4-amino-4-deoxy-L-arabinose transferase-like glycosyltransferase